MSTHRHHIPRTRGLPITLMSFIVVVGLVACGSDDGQDSANSTAAPGAVGNSQPVETTSEQTTTTEESTTTSEVPTPTSGVPDVCDPYGTLVMHEFNDRCIGATDEDFGDDFAEALIAFGYWVDQSCPNGALVVAQPKEVLVTVTDATQRETFAQQVAGLVGGTPDPDTATALAEIVDLPDIVQMDTILRMLPTLQGEGFSTDLNYLEPLQPNWGFRPADDPHPVPPGVQTPGIVQAGTGSSVLVLDSTDKPGLYDVDGNGMVDEDHGHGVFVQSIIQRQAAQASVTFQEVTSTAGLLPSGRWAPMMFSDLDLLTAMEPHFGTVANGTFESINETDVVNMSLGGAGCTMSNVYGYGIGERLSLARAMYRYALDTNMKYVAAAGNDHGLADGLEFKHFPAAWRDLAATTAIATEVELLNSAAALEIQDIHLVLVDAVIAVGASDSTTYTNCGDWINAKQPGTAVGTYPSPTGVAQWSGTSFATANASGLLAAGQLQESTLPC